MSRGYRFGAKSGVGTKVGYSNCGDRAPKLWGVPGRPEGDQGRRGPEGGALGALTG